MTTYAQEKAYSVTSMGPHYLNDWDFGNIPDNLKWLVYWYEVSGYEGAGAAIFKTSDGTYGKEELMHCSCYGPTESISWVGDMNAEQLKELLGIDKDLDRPRNPKDCDYAQWAALSPVVMGLLADEK